MIKDLTLGKVIIGSKKPVILIAECSDGHCGNLHKAKELAQAAKESGADVVKFQMHLPDIEMVPGVKMWAGNLQDILRQVWLSPDKHMQVKEYCAKVGIEYLCTPFSPEAVNILENMGVNGFKTGSGEITCLPLHEKLAKISWQTGKPVLISTGMAYMGEITETVSLYEKNFCKRNIVLLNCVSEYPVKDPSHMQLRVIQTLKKKFNVMTGHSDHFDGIETSIIAVTLGAKVIEKHFTLDRKGPFPDDKFSLDPAMFREFVQKIRFTEQTLLTGVKTVLKEEKGIRSWAFHSVVSDRDLKKGEILVRDNIRTARPGAGIPSSVLVSNPGAVLGRRVKKDIPANTVIGWPDIEDDAIILLQKEEDDGKKNSADKSALVV